MHKPIRKTKTNSNKLKGGINLDKQEYQKKVSAVMPPSPKLKNTVKAFLFGGLICSIGQAFNLLYRSLGAEKDKASTLVAITLITVSAVLTAIGVFDKIARHAGAGTIVPITGFANSVVSPAMEFKSEGSILGTAAKLFTISGPVIVYGSAAASVYGLIYYVVQKFGA